ncbi:3-hydroxyisobutyryl-CoA hydrolase, mitochondrial [Lepeophtheirus salmonis]|uniref:3-hydroxyisobutyryl-CoA hydrolase, mitochondrial n=1 Tax=Lepeophtheirus salmonis TaxID=72036 RepID=UPI00077F20DE|nr:3-hydroxyisobutyryl-CoA hydrolase, mitochondrial-like [Lepeophtheirus salmonis]
MQYLVPALRSACRTISKRHMSSNVNESFILADQKGKTGLISLNRPKALNSLNTEMIRTITQSLQNWKKEDVIDSLIIDSCVPKSFCSGGDIIAVTTKIQDPCNFFKEEYEMNYSLGTMKIPITSLISGIVMGGGVGISIHGKYRVATETTLFAMPEVSIGLFPDVGASWFLPRLKNKLGWYLGMTGYRLRGSDAYHAGIATHMCKTESLTSLKNDLCAAQPQEIESILSSYHDKFPIAPFSLSNETLSKIENIFTSVVSSEDLMETLENSKNDDFASKMLSTIRKASPTSIAITFRLLHEGDKAISLLECLNMEYNMSKEIMKRKDFYEGVRALLIDKDLSPKWSPSTMKELKNIDDFFKKDYRLDV